MSPVSRREQKRRVACRHPEWDQSLSLRLPWSGGRGWRGQGRRPICLGSPAGEAQAGSPSPPSFQRRSFVAFKWLQVRLTALSIKKPRAQITLTKLRSHRTVTELGVPLASSAAILWRRATHSWWCGTHTCTASCEQASQCVAPEDRVRPAMGAFAVLHSGPALGRPRAGWRKPPGQGLLCPHPWVSPQDVCTHSEGEMPKTRACVPGSTSVPGPDAFWTAALTASQTAAAAQTSAALGFPQRLPRWSPTCGHIHAPRLPRQAGQLGCAWASPIPAPAACQARGGGCSDTGTDPVNPFPPSIPWGLDTLTMLLPLEVGQELLVGGSDTFI